MSNFTISRDFANGINFNNGKPGIIETEYPPSMFKALKVGIDAAIDVDGVIGISAGNFGGKLGDKIYNLLDVLK